MSNRWTIEGYEFAVMQALNEGLEASAFDFSSLEEKGLCAATKDGHVLTENGQAVLQAVQNHLDNFSTDDEDEELIQAYEGPVKIIEIEFDEDMEDAEFISTEHIQLEHPRN